MAARRSQVLNKWALFTLVGIVICTTAIYFFILPEKERSPELCTIKALPNQSIWASADTVSHKPEFSGNILLIWNTKFIRVYFMDDDGNLINEVLRVANLWQPYTGRTFIQVIDRGSSDIRVSFRTAGWWSYIGTQSAKLDKSVVTLSLDSLWLHKPQKRKSVILHEFGHSLGLIHEHQSQMMKIDWDTTALYKYYKDKYGADPPWVRDNIINVYKNKGGLFCEPDTQSIMIYAIPKGLVRNKNYVVPEPLNLSELDKVYASRFYKNKKCE